MSTPQLTAPLVDRGWLGGKLWQQLRWIALLTLAVHLPLWVLSQWYYVQRPLISLDLLAGIALLSVNRRLGALGVLACWVLEGLVSQAATFHFATALDLLRSLRFAGSLNVQGYVTPALAEVALLFGASALICWAVARRARYQASAALSVALTVAILDALNGSSIIGGRGTQLLSVNLSEPPRILRRLLRLRMEPRCGSPRSFPPR